MTLSTAPGVAERLVEAFDRMVADTPGADALVEKAVAEDPGCAMAHALAAMLATRAGAGGWSVANGHIQRAREATRAASRREQQLVEVIAADVAQDLPTAAALAREHLEDFPRDIVALLVAFHALNFGGMPGAGPLASRLTQRLVPHFGDDWAFFSIAAFVQEESGRLDEAERFATRALELRSENALGVHALVHVRLERGQYEDGARVLRTWLASRGPAEPSLHLRWHEALFDLERGRTAEAVAGYRTHLEPEATGSPALVDRTSFLWRLVLDGALPGPHDEMKPLVASFDVTGIPFVDFHVAFGHACAEDGAALGRFAAVLRDQGGHGHPATASVVLPLAEGLGALCRKEYDEAVTQLEKAHRSVGRVGGSVSQRRVLEDTLVAVLVTAGMLERARDILGRRLSARPSARDEAWLARAI